MSNATNRAHAPMPTPTSLPLEQPLPPTPPSHIPHSVSLPLSPPLLSPFPSLPSLLSHLPVRPNPEHPNPRKVEAVLERIWDLHDHLSDAILAVSRAHFLPAPLPPPSAGAHDGGGRISLPLEQPLPPTPPSHIPHSVSLPCSPPLLSSPFPSLSSLLLSHLPVRPNPEHPNPRRPEPREVMRWDAAEAEAVLERIWDLHDRLSDAILAVSRAHFLPAPPPPPPSAGARDGGGRNGYVFVKGRQGGGGEVGGGSAMAAAAEAMAEARSLHAIRTALEDLEDHLEFLHTVQSQQRAERDAAIARLEQSRLVLAMRLAEHQGKKCGVIDEALAFVGEVSDKSRFISPEDVRATHSQSGENAVDNGGNGSSIMANVLSCSLSLAKNSFRVDKIGGALGNAAVFAVGMLALLQLHQVASGGTTPAVEYRKRIDYRFQSGSSQQNGRGKHLEVYLARG